MIPFDNKEIIEAKQLIDEYHSMLDGIPVMIRIRLYRHLKGREGVEFDQSHYIHTPTQADPYITSRNMEGSEESALARAVSTITNFYNGAVRAGHVPADSWLVPNDDF